MQDEDTTLLRAGETCWRVSLAERATLLIDGEAYFSALRAALLSARRHILIAGWDFDSRTVLPRSSPSEAPLELGALLGDLVRTRPDLSIHVLRWDYHWIYRDDREADTRERLERLGIRFHDDPCHPMTGCVHHKVVVIDDALAFCGGIDLTHKRWDKCCHDLDEPERHFAGEPYIPVHDTQLCVSGPIARDLGDYLRQHWPEAALPEGTSGDSYLWPPRLHSDFQNIRVGICRTVPASPERSAIREIEQFYLAAIGRLHRSLYIENQYFTSTRIARAIAERCRRVPELAGLLVGMERPKTPVELHTMGYGRNRFQQVLEESGATRQVPLVAALTASKHGINMHSKLALFDDRWLTVGSANLNHRSMGFDVECNLVLEAVTDEHRQRLQFLRDQLIAEHTGMEVPELREVLKIHGLAQLPEVVQRPRRLVRTSSAAVTATFGPILAPLFDRDAQWPRPANDTPPKQRSLLLVGACAAIGISVGALMADDAPIIASVQKMFQALASESVASDH
jgi:phospholipase D1/2